MFMLRLTYGRYQFFSRDAILMKQDRALITREMRAMMTLIRTHTLWLQFLSTMTGEDFLTNKRCRQIPMSPHKNFVGDNSLDLMHA